MFVNTIEFPPIKESKEDEFVKWFLKSNLIYSKFDGLISRRLLKSTKDGRYTTLVEHESEKTFMIMHKSPERQYAWEQLKPLIEGTINPRFYEVVNIQ